MLINTILGAIFLYIVGFKDKGKDKEEGIWQTLWKMSPDANEANNESRISHKHLKKRSSSKKQRK